MKLSDRVERYRTSADPTSAYLAGFRFDVDYFTHWPQQDRKALKNLVSTRDKLVLQTRGSATLSTREDRFVLEAGSVALIPPYAVYNVQTHDGVDSYEVFFNLSPYTREQEFLQQFGLTRVMHFPGLLTPELAEALAGCYSAVQQSSEGGYAQLVALVTLLLAKLIRAQGAPAPVSCQSPREQEVMRRLFAYLDANLSQNVRVADLCAALHVSQSYLYRCSRAVMNCSTQQVVIRYKLRHARTLLKNPEITIGEAAAAIGYDLFYFSSQFKKAFLVSPSEFRNNPGTGS